MSSTEGRYLTTLLADSVKRLLKIAVGVMDILFDVSVLPKSLGQIRFISCMRVVSLKQGYIYNHLYVVLHFWILFIILGSRGLLYINHGYYQEGHSDYQQILWR